MNETVNKKIVLLITTLSSFLAPFMASSVFIGLPSIGNEFAMDAVMLNWISTSYLLAAAMFLVPFGRIADIYGRKKIFKYGIIIDFIASILLAFSGAGVKRGPGAAFRLEEYFSFVPSP
jgi:MFS family permease